MALRLILEKLTQRNFEFVTQWETLKAEQKVVNIDKEKRQRKGLGHRRRGKDTMGNARPALVGLFVCFFAFPSFFFPFLYRRCFQQLQAGVVGLNV
jgi:hypothetical protein